MRRYAVTMLSTDLVLVSGKGGTGKSAVTAAIAIERARRGQTVLAIDLGSGLGLGEHLGTPSLRYEPTRVHPGLWAMTMVRAAALDEYLKTQLHVPSGAPTKTITAALNVLVDTAPGVREIISIGKPVFEVWRDRWDAVIVDTPSLGQFQSYLRAPTTIADLVPTGNVKRQASSISDVLTDPESTKVVLVTNPDELPVNETAEAMGIMRTESLCPPPVVVMNRLVDRATFTTDDLTALPESPLRSAAQHQLAIERIQYEALDNIDVDAALPYLRGVLTPGEIAFQLADALEAL
jgi:anion-transporting  ArsA/GET3 family ATPase